MEELVERAKNKDKDTFSELIMNINDKIRMYEKSLQENRMSFAKKMLEQKYQNLIMTSN